MEKHPLQEYAEIHGKKYRDIAVIIGCTAGYVALMACGARKPSTKLSIVIEKKLGIPKNRLRPDVWQ